VEKPRVLYEGCPQRKSGNISPLRIADSSIHPLYHPVISRTMNWLRCNGCTHVFTDGFFSNEVCEILSEKIEDT
jgi:hypothetical protein